MRHGTERFFIKDEGLIVGKLFPLYLIRWIYSLFFKQDKSSYKEMPDPQPGDGDEDDTCHKPPRLFCRLFKKGAQGPSQGLVNLGLSMETETGTPEAGRDSTIPAGYTYLGQFIDHDITFDKDTPLSQSGAVNPEEIRNSRTPALDLDSLYGGGPGEDPQLYEADGKTFRIGTTSDVGGLGTFPNDLPRDGTTAIIGDPRNDENLAVAQTHLAILKFHNAKAAAMPSSSFTDVRKEVVLHYQAIVLTDFLPRVVDPVVLQDVLDNGRRFYTDEKRDCMPVEFSVAAYRMGHSMVRPSYEWNRLFNSTGPNGIATFGQIFEFSGGGGSRGVGDPPFRGLPTLPSNWIVDWRRMYALTGTPHPQLNFARLMDAQMALDLKTLPEFQKMVPQPPAPLLSLATRNLLRGRLLSLPTGQDVAAAMGITPLSPTEITSGAPNIQVEILRDNGFDEATPLWYYILREAKVKAAGNHLGPVGSRIVAETLVGLIEHSQTNIRQERPGLRFSMPELLAFVGDINPLGD
jgi:Animal haem peroxidase